MLLKLKQLQDNRDANFHFLMDDLLANEDNLEQYTKLFCNMNFYKNLYSILSNDEEYEFYPKEIHDKIGKIIEIIENNSEIKELDIYKEIKEKYNSVKNKNWYGIYDNEILLKYDTINGHLKDKVITWKIDDINKSFKFDHIAFFSIYLQGHDEEIKKEYVLNYNYLLFVKKLLKMYPSLVLIKKCRNDILQILKNNIEANKCGDTEELIRRFYNRNYEVEMSEVDKLERYNKFKELNNNLYNIVLGLNSKNYNKIFVTTIFEEAYFQAILEKKIVLNSDVKIDYTNLNILNYLYLLIDYYNDNDLCTSKMQSNIIDIMDNFKLNYKGDKKLFLGKYNEYLIKVNSMNITQSKFMVDYMKIKMGSRRDVRRYLEKAKNDNTLIEDFMDTLNIDYLYLESLLCDKDYNEKFLKHFIYDDDYYMTIKRYIREYPSLFKNKEIYDKTVKSLEVIIDDYNKNKLQCNDEYKVLKKVKKIYGEKR